MRSPLRRSTGVAVPSEQPNMGGTAFFNSKRRKVLFFLHEVGAGCRNPNPLGPTAIHASPDYRVAPLPFPWVSYRTILYLDLAMNEPFLTFS